MKAKFTIKFHKDGQYNWQTIPEELCKKMCTMKDQGPRWSNSSRYLYSLNGYSENKDGFRFGTAKACVQGFILENNKTQERFDVVLVENLPQTKTLPSL